MKKVLYLLIVILTISCSKNDEPLPVDQYSTDQLKLMEYKVENLFADTSPVNISLSGGSMFFSGQLKNSKKFGFIGFNAITKEKLFDLIPFEYTSITVDEPYVGKKQIEFSSIRVIGFAENSSKSKVVYLGVSDGSNNGIVYIYYISYIYFINGNEVTNIIGPNNNIYPDIIPWGQNFLIGDKLYSPAGDIIMTVKLRTDYLSAYNYEIINDFEAITIENNETFFARRIDLREEYPKWEREVDISNLDRPRFDETKLISKTDTHFTYELHYTEYSGNKGVIKFKINIATGEIEYL